MAIDVRKSEFLNYLSYNTSLNINPKNVYYQRIRSDNVSTNIVQWAFNNPNKRAMLLSMASIEWTFSLQRLRDDGVTTESWGGNTVHIAPKHQFPFQNACSSITTSINSATQTITQPRRYIDILNRMCISREENLSGCYEYGYPDSAGGHATTDNPATFHYNEVHDDGMVRSAKTFYDELIRADKANGNPLRLVGEGVNTSIITGIKMVENVVVPPFDGYWCVSKHDMPEHLPWKHMSPVVGNIDRIELSLNFQNLSAGALFPYYASTAANNEPKQFRILDTGLEANLMLSWYELPTNMTIPRTIDYNTWDVREYVTPAANNNVPITPGDDTADQVNGNLIQLKSMPSFIIIHARRDQDSADYLPKSFFHDSDGAGANLGNSGAEHSFDSKLEIRSLNVLLGNRPNVVNVTINQQRLYDITQRNCKKLGLSFNDWRGWLRNAVAVAGQTLAADGGFTSPESFLVFTAQDLAEELSDGVAFPISLQVQVNMTARDGIAGTTGGDQIYKLYQHVFYTKHFLRLSQDSGGQFEEQLLNADASRAITEGSGDQVNQLSDSMSALGSLQRLRQMNGTGGALGTDYRSRL